jgi:CubicO group peptidase (beta-lactamase class C family)
MKPLLLLLCLALPLPAADDPIPQSIPELRAEIEKVLTEEKVPAAGVALVSRDEVLWVDGIGQADVAAGVDATADTMFRIGSISKSFAALTVLQLVEEGRLDLNMPLKDLAPDVFFENRWHVTSPVRLVHLLEHTTGFDDLALREYANNDPKPLTLLEGLSYYPNSRVSRWRPGTYFSYCNSGPGVAAHVVERLTGQPFDTYLEEKILRPLGMDHASLLLTDTVKQRLAKGYWSDGITETPYWHLIVRPAGALNASPREMASYARMLLNRGSLGDVKIVEPASVERMETPGTSIAARRGLRHGYGLGNYWNVAEGFAWHGHNGGMTGFAADLFYLPREGVGLALMINSSSGKALGRIRGLMQRYLVKDIAKPGPPPAAGDDLEQYEGYYVPYSVRIEASRFISRVLQVPHVSAASDALKVTWWKGGAARFFPLGAGRFTRKDTPVATDLFTVDDDGNVILWGRAGMAYKKTPAVLVLIERALWLIALLLVVSCILFALWWVPAKLLGKLKAKHLGVRAFPLVSILFFAAGFLLMGTAMNSMYMMDRLGNPTVWSWGFFACTVAFAVTAIAGLARTVRSRDLEIHRAVWWHSLLVSLALTGVAAYLAYWGVIGARTWV